LSESEIVSFAVQKVNKLKEDDRFIYLDMQIALVGLNSNKSFISKSAYDDAKPTIEYIPICATLASNKKDFLEHEGIPKLKCIGVILSLQDNNYRYETLEDENGNDREYIFVNGIIFKEYCPIESKIILENIEKSTSLEIEVLQKTKKDGLFYFDKFRYQSCVVIGSKYEPGMKDSHLEVASDYKEKYSQDIEKIKYVFSKQTTDTDNKFQLGDSVIPTELHMPEHEGKIGIISEVRNGNYYAIKFTDTDEQHEWYAEDELKIADKDTEEFISKDEIGINEKINIDLQKENFKESEVDKMAFNKEEFTQKFGLTANQLRDSMNEACNSIKYKSGDYEYTKYWVSDYDEKYAYSYDYELNKYMALSYKMEDGKCLLDFAGAKPAKTMQTWIVEGEEDGEMPEPSILEELLAKILEKVSAEKVDFAAKVESEKETMKAEFSQEKETMKETMTGTIKETVKAEFAIQIDEKQNSIVSLGQELDGLKEQFTAKETEIETFKSEVATFKNENETLKSDIAKFAKEKKETHAEVILSKFAKKISEDERKELFGKLEKFSTVEDFEKEVKAFVCDKYEAETKGKGNKEFTTYSRMSVNTTIDVKSDGNHWTDYIKEYKQE